MNERQRRLWAASEAMSLGYDGVTIVANATGMSRVTITQGVNELRREKRITENRCRREGGGRKNNRSCSHRLTPSSNRRPKVTPYRHFVGRRRASGVCAKSSMMKDSTFRPDRFADCYTNCNISSPETASPSKEGRIRTETLNSNSPTSKSENF